jgi:hypothetical protein
MPEPQCPECEKLSKVSKQSDPIGQFLEWLKNARGYKVAEYITDPHSYRGEDQILVEVKETTEQLLADYFDIDLEKVEKERQMLLNWLREENHDI